MSNPFLCLSSYDCFSLFQAICPAHCLHLVANNLSNILTLVSLHVIHSLNTFAPGNLAKLHSNILTNIFNLCVNKGQQYMKLLIKQVNDLNIYKFD